MNASDLFAWSLHVLPVCENMNMRLIGKFKLSLGANESVNDFLFQCGPAMNWQLNRCVALSLANGCWKRLLLNPITLSTGMSGYGKLINNCKGFYLWKQQTLIIKDNS